MNNQYSSVINATEYTSGLSKHLRIPQIDSKTIEEISSKTIDMLKNGLSNVKILDLGCGPGRLTHKIAQILTGTDIEIIGLDMDEDFIKKAQANSKGFKNLKYNVSKLPDSKVSADIMLIYGVRHHLDNEGERKQWKDMIVDGLSDNGSLFLGDEFIAEYNTEEERLINATKLYMNVIGDAYQIAGYKIDELVKIEIMNRVEDLYEGGYGGGVINPHRFEFIAGRCIAVKNNVVDVGYSTFIGNKLIKNLHNDIKTIINMSYDEGYIANSRGDYKISVPKQIEELKPLKLKNKYFSGNEQAYGGMGLLEFGK